MFKVEVQRQILIQEKVSMEIWIHHICQPGKVLANHLKILLRSIFRLLTIIILTRPNTKRYWCWIQVAQW